MAICLLWWSVGAAAALKRCRWLLGCMLLWGFARITVVMVCAGCIPEIINTSSEGMWLK
jgi:hypothetical protein